MHSSYSSRRQGAKSRKVTHVPGINSDIHKGSADRSHAAVSCTNRPTVPEFDDAALDSIQLFR